MAEKGKNNEKKDHGGLGLPEGYFDRSAARILDRLEWQEEHASFPALVKHRRTGVFACPYRYFERSEAAAEILIYKNLSSLKTLPFTLPSNYFEERMKKALDFDRIEKLKFT